MTKQGVNRHGYVTLYRQGVIIYSYLISLICIRTQGVNSTPIGGHVPMPIHRHRSRHGKPVRTLTL